MTKFRITRSQIEPSNHQLPFCPNSKHNTEKVDVNADGMKVHIAGEAGRKDKIAAWLGPYICEGCHEHCNFSYIGLTATQRDSVLAEGIPSTETPVSIGPRFREFFHADNTPVGPEVGFGDSELEIIKAFQGLHLAEGEE